MRAGLESIAYQITDVVNAMSEESGIKIQELRVDGGPTRNKYLMQFQSDIAALCCSGALSGRAFRNRSRLCGRDCSRNF